MTMTLETLHLLRNMLAGVTLQVGAPDFLDTAKSTAKALVELDKAIEKETDDA